MDREFVFTYSWDSFSTLNPSYNQIWLHLMFKVQKTFITKLKI